MNDLTTKNENTNMTVGDSWGSEGTSNQDILIPRLQLMQDISESVKKRKHDAGQIIDSTTGQVLMNEGEGLSIIPFLTFREWLIFSSDPRGGDELEFQEKILMTSENENLSKEDMLNGIPIKRFKAINFFAMLPGKLDVMPYLVSFKKTSLFAGRQLSTHFQISAMKGEAPAATKFKLNSEEKSWKTYTFKVFSIEPDGPSTEEEIAACKKWYEILKINDAKIADEFTDDFDPEVLGG